MARKQRIKEKLSVLKPHLCEIIDESYKHFNHQYGGIESHLKLQISSALLLGKNLVEKHRMINSLLVDEFKDGLHALSIEIL